MRCTGMKRRKTKDMTVTAIRTLLIFSPERTCFETGRLSGCSDTELCLFYTLVFGVGQGHAPKCMANVCDRGPIVRAVRAPRITQGRVVFRDTVFDHDSSQPIQCLTGFVSKQAGLPERVAAHFSVSA